MYNNGIFDFFKGNKTKGDFFESLLKLITVILN